MERPSHHREESSSTVTLSPEEEQAQLHHHERRPQTPLFFTNTIPTSHSNNGQSVTNTSTKTHKKSNSASAIRLLARLRDEYTSSRSHSKPSTSSTAASMHNQDTNTTSTKRLRSRSHGSKASDSRILSTMFKLVDIQAARAEAAEEAVKSAAESLLKVTIEKVKSDQAMADLRSDKRVAEMWREDAQKGLWFIYVFITSINI
jgi:hypothetical protein